jgi:hypothetical protein
MRQRSRILRTVSSLLGVGVLLGTIGLGAVDARVTRGDVMAATQARTTGAAILARHGVSVGAPAVGMLQGRIDPFPRASTRTYCAGDWHVLLVSFSGMGSHRTAAADLARFDASFELDGQLVPSQRTAVKRFLPQTGTPTFGVSVYHLLAPGSIGVGSHTLVTTFTEAGAAYDTLTLDFDVAASGEPCAA